MRPSRVFVSHTSDLAGHPPGRSFVRAALDAVNRARMVAVDMRFFAAREARPADYCQQRVRDCDVYVAIVGLRYGSLVPDAEVSYTELEFVEAGVAGIPRLVFLLDAAESVPVDLVDEDRARVDAFRGRLREAGLICATFRTADGLELAVYQALTELGGADARAVPRQLPGALPYFSGRVDELAVLAGLLPGRAEAGGTVVISAIGGTAGVGKTALAVYWAHRVAERFPDGQLYANLRGFDPTGKVLDPSQALRQFLGALGVEPQRIPTDLDAQAALYRSALAGRRMLVLLDNARDVGQVRPLLPGAPGCLVLVTSRNQLTGLVAAEGAQPVTLDVLGADQARELLARRLGASRVAAEPEAVRDIVASCARLPLALALVAARATVRPGLALRVLAGELRDIRRRWEALAGDDLATGVRGVFSWSYQALTAPAARLFRQLGLHPGPDTAAAAAASLAGVPPEAVRPLLDELVRTGLLTEHSPGRYAFHDLLRGYATHLAHTTDTEAHRRAATGRILDHYLHTAHTAALLLDPAGDPVHLDPPGPGVTPEELPDRSLAMAWFTAEHQVLLAAVDQTTSAAFYRRTGHLASCLFTFLDRQGHWHDQLTVARAAVAAADHLAEPAVRLRANRTLAGAYARLGMFEEAETHLRRALDLHDPADRTNHAHTHLRLALLAGRRDRPADALDQAALALGLFELTGDRNGQANALNTMGWYHAVLGDHRQALARCRQAMVLHRELADLGGQAETWDSLGYAHHHLHEHAEALACYHHALTLFRTTGDRYNEATVLTHIADAHHASGDPAPARDAWRRALTILNELNHPDADQLHARLTALDPQWTT